ncbi:MAG: 3'-5' exoribonuclease YhaM family protein [Thermoleophilia bacterium]
MNPDRLPQGPERAPDAPSNRDGSSSSGAGPASERAALADLIPGMTVNEIYLVKSKETRTTKSGKPFLKLRLGDRSGIADCMVWEDAERISAHFEAGDLVTVQGRASEYQGNLQLEATDIRSAAGSGVDARAFLPSTYRDIDELVGFLEYHVDSVYDRDYSALLRAVFGDQSFLGRFADAPAAKTFHHAYLGGLLEHTVTVADLCDHISQQYARVNRDLLITSALLHDIGKVDELTYESTIDYSESGRFLGHVILGVMFVSQKSALIPGFPEKKLELLLHAIVSHHGELEWGSPKRPKTLEALILHHVDNLDAKIKGFLEIVEGSRDADWTDLRNLFRRPLHVPRASHQEEDFLPPHEGERMHGA